MAMSICSTLPKRVTTRLNYTSGNVPLNPWQSPSESALWLAWWPVHRCSDVEISSLNSREFNPWLAKSVIKLLLNTSNGQLESFARPSTARHIVSSLRSTAQGFASRWARTFVGDFLKQQLRSVVEHQDDRTAKEEWTQANFDGSQRMG